MQHITRRKIALFVSVAVGAAALIVPGLGSTAAGTESGPTFASAPRRGLTGTAVEASGTGCFLPDATTPGDGVIVDLHTADGPVVASATLPVRTDGQWSGTLTVPAGTPAGGYTLAARCIYPGFDERDPVVYADRTFTVTGEGPDAPAADAPTVRSGGIEPLPSYDGQSTCSPTVKPGTGNFRSMVMAAFGGADYGIVRACTIGGTSEHKEGRAWDWGMNANSSSDRAKVARLVSWLLASDSAGNRYAMARRLGIMYIIWNRQMFRLYRPESGWTPYTGPVPHTDHVHFSLTRAGGAGTTSFWRGGYPRPGQTTPPPTTRPPTTPPPTTPTVRSSQVTVGGTYDAPVSGDFNGDGEADVLWYGAGSRPDYLWFGSGSGGFTAKAVTVRGVYQPLAGDFNGDRRADILWYGAGAKPDYLWFGTTSRSFAGRDVTIGRQYDRPMVGDFNGDRFADVFWYQPGGGFDYLWHGTVFGFIGSNISADGEYRAFTGDFDGDRRDDVFWYGPGNAADYLWFGNRDTGFTGRGINETRDARPVVGDYNDDGEDDIIWYGAGSRADGVWYGRTTRTFQAANLAVNGVYDAPLPGDYDGNGNADVIWYGRGNRPDYLWRY